MRFLDIFNIKRYKDFRFTINKSEGCRTVTIVGYKGKSEKVVIPEFIRGMPVTAIDDSAFDNCNEVKHIILPKCLVSIENCIVDYPLFLGYRSASRKLIEISVDENNPALTAVDGVLYDKTITTLVWYPPGKKGDYTFPDTVFDVGYGAFNGCKEVTRINISKNIMSLENFDFFALSDLQDITASENNPEYSSIDGVLFNKEGTSLIVYPQGKVGTDYIVPNGVKCIKKFSFNDCNFLTKIILPEGLKVIESAAFHNCKNLAAVTLPSSLPYLERMAFCVWENLETITLSRNTKLGYKALEGFSGRLIYRD